MRHRIYSLLLVSAVLLALGASGARASVPCSEHICETHLAATPHVKHWTVPGKVGESWLLYLNIYSGGKRLGYQRLAGACDASYASAAASAVLHACGRRSTLEYVSFAGSRSLRVTYHYARR